MSMKTKLPELCKIQYGYAFDSDKFTDDDKFLPLVRIRDVKRGYSETYYDGQYPNEYIIHYGDLLIGMDGEFNIARWKSREALLNQRVCRIVANPGTNEEYLRFALTKALKEIENRTAFVTVKHLSAKELNRLELNIPELEKQNIIAKTLSKLESIIGLKNREVELLDNLIKARFVEMFGDLANPKCEWEKFPLVKMCKSSDDIKCGPFGTQLSKDEYHSTGIMVWEIPQINSSFKTKPTKFLTNEKAKELQAYSIIPGDIAMSRKGNVGKCALFPENYPNGIIHSDVLRIRVDQGKVNPCFMMHQFHYSRAILNQIDLVSHGAIMAGINVTKLKNIIVHLPPKNIQDDFSSFVSQIDKSKVVYLKAAREYHKQSKVVEMKMLQR